MSNDHNSHKHLSREEFDVRIDALNRKIHALIKKIHTEAKTNDECEVQADSIIQAAMIENMLAIMASEEDQLRSVILLLKGWKVTKESIALAIIKAMSVQTRGETH